MAPEKYIGTSPCCQHPALEILAITSTNCQQLLMCISTRNQHVPPGTGMPTLGMHCSENSALQANSDRISRTCISICMRKETHSIHTKWRQKATLERHPVLSDIKNGAAAAAYIGRWWEDGRTGRTLCECNITNESVQGPVTQLMAWRPRSSPDQEGIPPE